MLTVLTYTSFSLSVIKRGDIYVFVYLKHNWLSLDWCRIQEMNFDTFNVINLIDSFKRMLHPMHAILFSSSVFPVIRSNYICQCKPHFASCRNYGRHSGKCHVSRQVVRGGAIPSECHISSIFAHYDTMLCHILWYDWHIIGLEYCPSRDKTTTLWPNLLWGIICGLPRWVWRQNPVCLHQLMYLECLRLIILYAFHFRNCS